MSIQSRIKKFGDFFRKGSHVFQMDPYSDWEKIVVLFLVLSVFVLIGDGYLFYKVNLDELFVPTQVSTTRVESFDRTTLEQENKVYDAAEQKFNALKDGVATTTSN